MVLKRFKNTHFVMLNCFSSCTGLSFIEITTFFVRIASKQTRKMKVLCTLSRGCNVHGRVLLDQETACTNRIRKYTDTRLPLHGLSSVWCVCGERLMRRVSVPRWRPNLSGTVVSHSSPDQTSQLAWLVAWEWCDRIKPITPGYLIQNLALCRIIDIVRYRTETIMYVSLSPHS